MWVYSLYAFVEELKPEMLSITLFIIAMIVISPGPSLGWGELLQVRHIWMNEDI